MSPILTQPLQTVLEKKGPLRLGPIPCRHRSPGKPLLAPLLWLPETWAHCVTGHFLMSSAQHCPAAGN